MKSRLDLSIALAVLFGCTTVPKQSERRPATFEDYKIDHTSRYFTFSAPPFHLAQIDLKRATAVESFLKQLPVQMRLNHALVYESGSLHDATFENPRAIYFDDTAEVVVTHGGHAGLAGGLAIEAMEYNWTTERYDLHEYDYAGARMVHTPNPVTCRACHSDANAPQWASYHDWRGAYGSNFNGFDTKKMDRLDANDFENHVYLSAGEDFRAFQAFTARQKSHPRYAYLARPTDQPYWPFTTDKQLEDKDLYDFSPNRRLGIGLRFHQGRSNAIKLSRSRLFRDYPAHVIYSLIDCVNDESRRSRIDDWDSRLGDATDKLGLPRHRNAMWEVAGVVPYRNGVTDRARSTGPVSDDGGDIGFAELSMPGTVEAAVLWHLARDKFGVALEPEGPTVRMARAMGAPVQLLQKLQRIVPLYSLAQFKDRICPSLPPALDREARANLPIEAELSAAQRRELGEHAAGKPYVLRQCIVCHDNGHFAGAPDIPFGDRVALKVALRGRASTSNRSLFDEIKKRTAYDAADRYRMPKGAYGLPSAEQRRLIKYLEDL